jgi:hypothetical protein
VLHVHSTRLFPKNQGADGYALSGIAARCDWVVLSDWQPPHCALRRVRNTDHPEHIFLSMRQAFRVLPYFVEEILPRLSRPFILISGSEDLTLPRQTDQRWRSFEAAETAAIAEILDHPLLRHWVAENLDQADHPKLAPLPVGMVFSDEPKIRDRIEVPAVTPLADRPLTVLSAHRERPGPQWEPRRQVSQLASTVWSGFCHALRDEVTETEFLAQTQRHAFILCVEGGGLDPAPKAWQALLQGTIPIVRRSPLEHAYRHLPIAWVDDWTPDAISPERLQAWRQQLGWAFDTAPGRALTVQRLGLQYWWNYAQAPFSEPETPWHTNPH